jgi:cytochrome b
MHAMPLVWRERGDAMEMHSTTTPLSAAGCVADACAAPAVKVWDFPTRLFHWALVACVTGAVVTAQIGGNWIDWHIRLGIATLALLVFRLIWGVAGPRYARFHSFVYTPREVIGHVKALRASPRHAGHSPSGAVSVLVLLMVLGAQVASGLLSSDFISTEGPLVRFVSESTVDLATWLHLKLQWVLYALVALHFAAVLAYLVLKKDNLIIPMVTGWKAGVQAPHANDSLLVRVTGLVLLLALGAAGFWFLG